MRIGFASQDVPFNIPHCIARRINPQEGVEPKFFVRDQVMQIRGMPFCSVCCNFDISLLKKSYACLQMLNCHATSSQNAERESAYDIVQKRFQSFSFWTMFDSVPNELLLLQIAALMKIPFLDEDMPSPNQPLPPKVLCIMTMCLYLQISYPFCHVIHISAFNVMKWQNGTWSQECSLEFFICRCT